MSDTTLKNKKPNLEKLLQFGFVMESGKYSYATDILDGQFKLVVTVLNNRAVSAKVTDSSSCEEYVLHRTSVARASFVGRVRIDYKNVLREIAEKCFELNVFKSDDARKVIQYVRNTYNDKLEFLWQRFSDRKLPSPASGRGGRMYGFKSKTL